MSEHVINQPKPNRYLMQPSFERFGHIGHFVPRKARDEAEIARRRRQPRGTLVLDQQARGLHIITEGLKQTGTVEEAAEWADCMALAGVGTSPYLFNGEVMNRYVPLPMLAGEQLRHRPTSEELRQQTIKALEKATAFAGFLTTAHTARVPLRKKERLMLKTGREIAYASFLLSVISLGDIISGSDGKLKDHRVQHMVREACMEAVQRAGTLALEIGAYPSAAQVADSLSPLGVEIQKAGTDTVERIYRSVTA